MDVSVNIDKSADISRLAPNLVYEALDSTELGLIQAEDQDRQKKQGKNLIEEKAKRYVILIFLSNFIHLMAILLWIGGGVAFLAGMPCQ